MSTSSLSGKGALEQPAEPFGQVRFGHLDVELDRHARDAVGEGVRAGRALRREARQEVVGQQALPGAPVAGRQVGQLRLPLARDAGEAAGAAQQEFCLLVDGRLAAGGGRRGGAGADPDGRPAVADGRGLGESAPNRAAAAAMVSCAKAAKSASALSSGPVSTSYQTRPAFSQAGPPMVVAASAKARFGMPEL